MFDAIWELGLAATVALCAWTALDLRAQPPILGLRRILALAIAVSAWCCGELLLHHAVEARELLWSRRLLFAGLCAFPPLWLWTAMSLSSGRSADLTSRRLLQGVTCVEALAYASLYVADGSLLISGKSGDASHGPLFAAHAVAAWVAIVWAIGLMARAIGRLRGASRLAKGTLILGAGIAVLVNWLYLAFDVAAHDPTPIAVGIGVLAFRRAGLELLGVPFLAALARRQALEELPLGVLVADSEGRVLEANRSAVQLLEAEPTGRRLEPLLAGLRCEPGFGIHSSPVSRHGVHVGEVVVLRDGRAQRAAERRSEVATRMEALGVLAHGLAHELNSPLTVVVAHADDLARRGSGAELSAESRSQLGEIAAAADQIAAIVSRMGHLAKPVDFVAGEVPRADLTAAIRQAAELATFGKSEQRIRLSIDEPCFVHARFDDLLQIALHLMMNALEAAPSESPVDVRIERTTDAVTLRVFDRGAGLADDDPSRVFDPFYTSKRPGRGIGLGLSLCWELARQNGGQLEARRRPGGGAVFQLALAPAPGLREGPEGLGTQPTL